MGKWNIQDLDKNKTESSIENEKIRLEKCHKEVDRLIEEADLLRESYESKYYSLCKRIDSIKKSIELGEDFIENCQEHLKKFENAETN